MAVQKANACTTHTPHAPRSDTAMPEPAQGTDAPPARLAVGLNWTNIGASAPEALRQRRAELLARLDADWRAAQAFWAEYRAAHCPGRVFERSA